eukprot:10846430-Alexandrium_andersonii.AAC.1
MSLVADCRLAIGHFKVTAGRVAWLAAQPVVRHRCQLHLMLCRSVTILSGLIWLPVESVGRAAVLP